MDTKELLKKVRKIEIKTRRLSDHVFGGEYHSTFKGRGMTFSEVRQYQFGDDVRNAAIAAAPDSMPGNVVTFAKRPDFLNMCKYALAVRCLAGDDPSNGGYQGSILSCVNELLFLRP